MVLLPFIEPADYEGSYITDDPSSLEYGGALVVEILLLMQVLTRQLK